MPSKFGKSNQELLDDIWWRFCTPEGLAVVGAAVAEQILNTPIQRGGAGAALGDGKTTLGGMVAWNDSHVIQIISAAAASTSQSGAGIEEIQEAVRAAIAERPVKVNVSVEGAAS